MRDVKSLTLEDCHQIIASIQETLWYTSDVDERPVWDPDEEWGPATLEYVGEALERHGLKPNAAGDNSPTLCDLNDAG